MSSHDDRRHCLEWPKLQTLNQVQARLVSDGGDRSASGVWRELHQDQRPTDPLPSRSWGNGCSTAAERTPHNHKVKGSNLAMCWAFSLSMFLNQVSHRWMLSYTTWGCNNSRIDAQKNLSVVFVSQLKGVTVDSDSVLLRSTGLARLQYSLFTLLAQLLQCWFQSC